jgi:hypothetical protein
MRRKNNNNDNNDPLIAENIIRKSVRAEYENVNRRVQAITEQTNSVRTNGLFWGTLIYRTIPVNWVMEPCKNFYINTIIPYFLSNRQEEISSYNQHARTGFDLLYYAIPLSFAGTYLLATSYLKKRCGMLAVTEEEQEKIVNKRIRLFEKFSDATDRDLERFSENKINDVLRILKADRPRADLPEVLEEQNLWKNTISQEVQNKLPSMGSLPNSQQEGLTHVQKVIGRRGDTDPALFRIEI